MFEENEVTPELFKNWKPKIMEDIEVDFKKPITGRYEVSVQSVTHKEVKVGDITRNIISFKLKVKNDISGDPSYNRFMNKDFWMGPSSFKDSPSGEEQLLNSLVSTEVTADGLINTTQQSLAMGNHTATASFLNDVFKDKIIRVRAYPSGKEKTRQTVIFVKPIAKIEKGPLEGLSF